jgi:hypothetical protein
MAERREVSRVDNLFVYTPLLSVIASLPKAGVAISYSVATSYLVIASLPKAGVAISYSAARISIAMSE